MSKPLLGMIVGALLGLLDGISAWFSPDARPIFLTIVVGSTLKGLVTGLVAGVIARRRHSMLVGITAGLVVGLVLSALAAIGQPDHAIEIVLPGMLVGAIVGFITQRSPASIRARSAGTALGLALLAAATPLLAAAIEQQPPAPDPLMTIAPLLGRWSGTSEGQPGKGTVEREYERVFNGRFVRVRNRSVYRPQEKNPKGETHQDEGWFSADRARKRIVFRQFHIEGFVNQYVQDETAAKDQVVFTSEAIENIPAGFRARETYHFTGPDTFEEVFELAEPGKSFEVYSRARFTRVR